MKGYNLIRNVIFLASVISVIAGCSDRNESLSGTSNVIAGAELESQAKNLAEHGDLDEALRIYAKAIKPEYISQEYEKGVAIAAMAEIYKWQGKYDEAIKTRKWFLDKNPQNIYAQLPIEEIQAIAEYKKNDSVDKVYSFISKLKKVNKEFLPPTSYQFGSASIVSDVLQLYDTIGDYDSGIAFIDEILAYFRSGKAGDPNPGRVDAEYMKVREAFEQDKSEGKKGSMKEGKPGRATLALIQSDYFPW